MIHAMKWRGGDRTDIVKVELIGSDNWFDFEGMGGDGAESKDKEALKMI